MKNCHSFIHSPLGGHSCCFQLNAAENILVMCFRADKHWFLLGIDSGMFPGQVGFIGKMPSSSEEGCSLSHSHHSHVKVVTSFSLCFEAL